MSEIKYPLCIAHRGAAGVAPENTMLAFRTAIEARADMIELDVQMTKDGEIVVFHDRSMERITDDLEGIADFTLAELKEKEVGSWMNEGYAHIKIPTLRQAMAKLPHEISYIIEIKPQSRKIEEDRNFEKKVCEILNDYSINNGYIAVRDVDTYEWFKDNTNYRCGLMQKKRTPKEFHHLLQKHSIKIAQTRIKSYTPKDYKKLKEIVEEIYVYYADIPKDYQFLIDQEVTGILTNYPALYRGYLSGLNIPG